MIYPVIRDKHQQNRSRISELIILINYLITIKDYVLKIKALSKASRKGTKSLNKKNNK